METLTRYFVGLSIFLAVGITVFAFAPEEDSSHYVGFGCALVGVIIVTTAFFEFYVREMKTKEKEKEARRR